MSRRCLPALTLLTLICAAAPTRARASNGVHPRTPVVWNDTPCMEFVDRSASPILAIPYDIPYEDTDVTADEVADSRTHQFIAVCRQHNPQEFLPNWISWADVAAAEQKSLVEMADVTDEDVFETSATWTDCWVRITPDDERRPITEAMAAQDIAWDTSSAAAGVYVLQGYTYEPALNLWSERYGSVVRVYDGGDPAASGPAAAIISREDEPPPYMGETVKLEGCVNTLPGSTLTASYASTKGSEQTDWEPAWVPFAEQVPLERETFSVDWLAPDELAGQSVMLRVVVTDPMDRTYEAYKYHGLFVIAGMNPNDCEETGGGFIENPGCETDSGDSTGAGTGPSSASDGQTGAANTSGGGPGEGSAADDEGGGGCACGFGKQGTAPIPTAAIVMVAGFALRRRRSFSS